MATPRLNDSRIGSALADDVGARASGSTLASPHAAHGVALFVTLERELTLTSRHATVRGRVVMAPADTVYALASPGPTLGICFDPERMPRVAGAARAAGRPVALDGRVAQHLVAALHAHRGELTDTSVLVGLAREAAAVIAGSPVPLDRRVAHVVEALRDPDACVPRVPISSAHLSELFARDVGVPIRTYRLWRRLLRALLAYARTDATTAAHAAGFADLAHFSRTCRRMLGYSPTILRDGVSPGSDS
ncbi:MAG TPA: helix-turn-helix domain-containing protein [Kofleriaceae bacterium]|nr:helix-turn-helix domain-containing protein [Kofleriaceae bacterium]